MIPLWVKIAAAIALLAALVVGEKVWEHHLYQQGYDAHKAESTIKAQQDLLTENARVHAAQAKLDTATAALSDKQVELQHEQIKSAALESDLRSSTQRLSVLVTAHRAPASGPATGTPPAGVDHVAYVTEDLAPDAAANLDRVRANENSAIDRLNGCIAAYHAVEQAANGLTP